MTPGVWAFSLLSLASWRLWKLLAEDTILDWPRARLVGNEYVSELVSCPWCLGAWVAVCWWAGWWACPHTTLVVAVPFALSATVGIIATAVHRLAGD